ncbi:ABC transporter permease [Demequina salsinemoris]|uniref:ABC transporter permease n=1 Tax=Demequina salsinemoris TaxID=577470 RepID=UPI000783E126|nr:ABC transporter permease [Demequina salsinemoris]
MLRYTLVKLVTAAILVAVVSTLTFFMLYGANSDPVTTMLGETATAEQIAAREAELGLDRPVGEQFASWVTAALHGDLGTSWSNRQPVAETLAARVPVTLGLAILAIIVSAVIGIALGVAAARFRGWVDVLLQVVVIVGFALPAFWFATLLSTTFGLQLGWFPALGYIKPSESIGGWLSTVTLPVLALAAGVAAAIAQQVRNSVIDVERRDFVRALTSRGIGSRRILLAHTLRNAAPAALTVISVQFIGLLGGAIIVENIFALPGLGALAIDATTLGDVPVVMGVMLVTVLIVVVVNLALDLIQGVINPKARVR